MLNPQVNRRPVSIRQRAALATYRRIAAGGGWPTFPAGKAIRPGDSDVRVPALRERLRIEGDLESGLEWPSLVAALDTLVAGRAPIGVVCGSGFEDRPVRLSSINGAPSATTSRSINAMTTGAPTTSAMKIVRRDP